MLLLEMEMLKGWNIEIIGTDISQRVLHAARHGVYSSSSFRTTDEYFVRRYFQQQEEGLRISDEVRQLVNISQLNLFDSGRIVLLGRMDVVFCRNVIIYFDNEAKKRVIESFYNTLQDGGFLLLGHSESLMNVSTGFTLRHFKNDMIYQKPARPVWGLKP